MTAALRLGTSVRCRQAADTLRSSRPLLADLGITRVTDITRMDRLGLPVFISIRPRGNSLRVHAGKGLLADEAQAGAVMEAVEYAVAERAGRLEPDAKLPFADWVAQLPDGLRAADFAPRLGIVALASRVMHVFNCELLSTGRTVALPAELVMSPCSPGNEVPLFGWSTNGLASGNTLEEASLHALFEVLERDAVACNAARDASAWVSNDDLPEPFARWALDWLRMGVELIVRHLPNDFGLPCFQACLHDATSLDVNLASGSGLHADRDIALARAVCEAAQSRAGCIHGGRDDLTRFYDKYSLPRAERQSVEARLLDKLHDHARRVHFGSLNSAPWASDPPELALGSLLALLHDLGFHHVFRRRLGGGPSDRLLGGFHVVKVVVARCETSEGSHGRMGQRLLDRVLGHG